MGFSAEDMIDRRRLRRKLTVWRVAALLLLAALLVVVPLGWQMTGAGGPTLREAIARVEISGVITEDEEMLELLDDLRKDDRVRGVILKINSPGGTTVGGETLYNAARALAAEKPLAAEVGTLAASAGYMVAAASDHIVAHNTSIVGSIGVIFQYVDASALLGRVGVDVNAVKSGLLKAEPSPFQPAPPEARAMIERLVNSTFEWFVALVAERREMPDAEVRRLADGSIFSGEQGLDNRLVDALGGEAEVRRWFVEEHGLDPDIAIVEREPKRERSALWPLPGAQAWLYGFLGLDPQSTSLPDALRRSTGQLDGLLSLWQPAGGS